MKNQIYNIFKADFLHRSRGYKFIIPVLVSSFVGYFVASNKIGLAFSGYIGIYNSAYLALTLALTSSFLFCFFGFYILRGNIKSDYESNIGPILASTSMSKFSYIFGKFLSNFAIFSFMILIQIFLAFVLSFSVYFKNGADVVQILYPFIAITLPACLFLSAFIALFEAVRILRGSFGNILYFIIFVIFLPVGNIGLNLIGFGYLDEIQKFLAINFPDYKVGGASITLVNKAFQTFSWPGFSFDIQQIFMRTVWILIGLAILFLTIKIFDRFADTDNSKVKVKSSELVEKRKVVISQKNYSQLTRLDKKHKNINTFKLFVVLVQAELRLLFKGYSWWWYLVTFAIMISVFFVSGISEQKIALSILFIWPLTFWSKLGVREFESQTQEIVFLGRNWILQTFASLFAGIFATFILCLPFLFYADILSLIVLPIILVPSIAFTAGVISKSSKLFEISYMILWYLGVMNRIEVFNFLDIKIFSNLSIIYTLLTISLIFLSFIIRKRQIEMY